MSEETKLDSSTQKEQGGDKGDASLEGEIGKDMDLTGLSPELKQKVEGLRHELNKAATKKFQDMSEKTRQLETLEETYKSAIKEAKETRDLADRHGLTV